MNVAVHLYIASPLFSDAEKQFNERLAEYLGREHRVFLPQRDGRLLVDLLSAGMSSIDAAQRIFEADVEAIRECDCLVAVLDGRSVDEGVAFELGVAFTSGKMCVGLQTDPRRLLPIGNNPMIECSLWSITKSFQDLAAWLLRSTNQPSASRTGVRQGTTGGPQNHL